MYYFTYPVLTASKAQMLLHSVLSFKSQNAENGNALFLVRRSVLLRTSHAEWCHLEGTSPQAHGQA